jgi:hypothetical protein
MREVGTHFAYYYTTLNNNFELEKSLWGVFRVDPVLSLGPHKV